MSRIPFILLLCSSLVCYCKAAPSSRIVGGSYAAEGQFAHQVSLRVYSIHNCGGSIISNIFILTAAHCVVGFSPYILTVRAGSIDRFRGGIVLGVSKIFVHETYGNFLNDVALLRLKEEIIFSDKIQPIPLASAEVPAGADIIISGWGRVKHGGNVPQMLKWNTLTVITQQECKEQINMDSESLICLAHESNNGACNGDSGGPAIYEGEVVGIAGFVYSGCGTSYPDGYANVFYHLDWIKSHVFAKS